MSPFLFLLATEALSRLLPKEEGLGDIEGIKMVRAGPSFLGLLFADDLFLFAKATDRDLTTTFSHLETYKRWSGQSVSRPKLAIHFSSNTPNARGKRDSLLSNFRWGQSQNGNPRVHLKAWDQLFSPKEFSGLGFRRMLHHNRASMAKRAWKKLQLLPLQLLEFSS